MKTKLILVLLAILCSSYINAQDTKQEVFTRIQKLADKAKGQKIQSNNVFSKKSNKLGKQVFTEKEVIVNTISEGKSDYERIKRATEIVWNDFFDYLIYTEFTNNNLQIVRLNFKNESIKNELFSSKDTGDPYPLTSSSFGFYVLTSDKNEITQLLDRLYDLKEKKPESLFNKEIKKFNKEETISWLKEKLVNNLAGDNYTNSIKLISIDACNIVFEHSNIVGRKYRETLPTSIESISKYNQFTYNKKICISKSFAFGMIQENDETAYENHSFLRINTKDEDLISNIEYALKHLAGFCSGGKINDTSLNYIKDFFESNFVKSVVKEDGKDKIYDYKIIDNGIIIYLHNISKPTNIYSSTNEWFYLAFDKINFHQYGSNLGYFENVNAIRFYQINGYIPHGPGNDHTKVEDATYGSGWLHIPFRYDKYSDLHKFKEILTNANVNE